MNDQPTFEERYRLIWSRRGIRRVGEVRNYAVDDQTYRVVPILLDDAQLTQANMRFLLHHWTDRGPEILTSSAFMNLPQRWREAGIWHEMGHVHHEHLLRGDFLDQDQLRTARRLATKEGHVMPYEGEADRFAVAQIGKDALVSFLEHLLETRPTGGRLGWNDMGRRELELRIAAIRTV